MRVPEVRKMTTKFIECENCEGSGFVEEECPESGQMIEVKCPDCEGSGKVKEDEEEVVNCDVVCANCHRRRERERKKM